MTLLIINHFRWLKPYMFCLHILLASCLCVACVTTPPKSSWSLAIEQPTKPPYFFPPNTLIELCISDMASHTINDTVYWTTKAPYISQQGKASWYGQPFHGRQTANGEIYNMHTVSAAHRQLPLPSIVIVTNLKNNQSIAVRVNDRGPYYGKRIIDLSYSAAKKINMVEDGVVPVQVTAMGQPILEQSLASYFNWKEDIQLTQHSE